MDDRLRALAIEQLRVLARDAAGASPEERFGDLAIELGRGPRAEEAYALGWLEGAADAADLTVLELLDEAGIPLDEWPVDPA